MKTKKSSLKLSGLYFFILCLIQITIAGSSIRPYVKIAIIQSGEYRASRERLESLGFSNITLLSKYAEIDSFSLFDMVYLPTAWASNNQGDPDSILARNEEYIQYIENGGSLLLEQPNPYQYNGGSVYVTLLPVPVTFTYRYNQNDFPPVIADTSHYLTNGLPATEMPFSADQVVNLDTSSYHVLAYGKYTQSPSLFIMEYGSGRTLIHTALANADAGYRISDTLLVRIISWLVPNVNSISDSEKNFISHFELKQNYPNPFNPETTILYYLMRSSEVEIIIYNILGKQIQKFKQGFQNPGQYRVKFNADGLTSGIYFYELNTSAGRKMHKMTYLK